MSTNDKIEFRLYAKPIKFKEGVEREREREIERERERERGELMKKFNKTE